MAEEIGNEGGFITFDPTSQTGTWGFNIGADDDRRRQLAAEAGWPNRLDEELQAQEMLFGGEPTADEVRLLELYTKSTQGALANQEYREITSLIFRTPEQSGVACFPCELGNREKPGSAVANTGLCKGHLRYAIMYEVGEKGPVRRILGKFFEL